MTTRREFIRICACAGALGALPWLTSGCGGEDGGPAAPEVTGSFSVDLAAHPSLAADESAVVISGTQAGSIFLTHTTGDTYFALSRVCTHQGCQVGTPSGGSAVLPCPCHGSRYRLDGTVEQGPAPRALTSWPVTLEGNTLTIHFG